MKGFSKGWRWDVLAVTLLVILWGIFFWRLLTPRAADQISFDKGDFSGHYIPFSAYLHNNLTDGSIPLWNPYNNGGFPFAGDNQSSIYYFPKWITSILIQTFGDGYTYHALELEALFHILFYTLAFYAFLRRLTLEHHASYFGAFFGAIVAGYSGYMSGYPPLQVQVMSSGVWMPLVLLGILEATRTPKLSWLGIILGAFALGNAWIAGHPQTTWFMSYLAVAWLWYRLYLQKSPARDYLLGAFALGAITFGITAVSFLPAYEYSSRSARADMGFDSKSSGFPYQDLIQLVLPHIVSLFSPLYIGISTLAVVFVGVKHHKGTRFWFWVLLFGLLFSFGSASALYQGLYNVLPGLTVFRGQERAIYISSIAVSIIAAYGVLVAYDQRDTLKRGAWVLLAITGVLASVMSVLWLAQGQAFAEIVNIAWFVLLMSGLFLGLVIGVSQTLSRPLWATGLIALLVFDVFSLFMFARSNYDYNPPTQQLSITVPDRLRVVADDENEGQPFRVDGYRGLQEDYGSLYGIMDMRGISSLILGSVDKIVNRNYVSNSLAWEVYAVKYIFNENVIITSVATELIGEGQDYFGKYYLHRVLDPRPFAQLVYDVAVVDGDEFALALLSDPNFNRRDSLALHAEVPIDLPEEAPEGASARVTEFLPERIVVSVNTPENAMLSLSHNDYPGWVATLDGERVPIYRANGGLTAVAIPSGEHELVLVYDPLSFKIGFAMSLVTWLGVAGYVLYAALRSRRQAQVVAHSV